MLKTPLWDAGKVKSLNLPTPGAFVIILFKSFNPGVGALSMGYGLDWVLLGSQPFIQIAEIKAHLIAKIARKSYSKQSDKG